MSFFEEVESGVEQPFESPAELDRFIDDKVSEYISRDTWTRPPYPPKEWAAKFRSSDKYKSALAAATERHEVMLAKQAQADKARQAEKDARAAEEKASEEENRLARRSAVENRLLNNAPDLKARIDKNGKASLSELDTAESVSYFLAANSWVQTDIFEGTRFASKFRREFSLDGTTRSWQSERATSIADRFDGYTGGENSKPYTVSQGEYRDTGEKYWRIDCGLVLLLVENNGDIALADYKIGDAGVMQVDGYYARVFREGFKASDK